ncbi:sperm motility kinase Y-like [Ochotona princeps]|uniref:sperm motility kinase Y-like n=1 Tax=Ochotona princeps TaxID=9978 RepID=UPI0027153A44|nr:sperm motility kinase Y-like [Ochotona princeps]
MEGHVDLEAVACKPLQVEIVSVLGEGTFGVVLLARTPSGTQVAVKVAQEEDSPHGSSNLRHEAGILRRLKHDHIIRLLQVGQIGGRLCLLMELANGGNLKSYVMSRGGLEEDEARDLLGQVLGAVEYCHGQRIAHRDLKPRNVLLDSSMHVKLADFGLSCLLPEGELVIGSCGTLKYSAPEGFLHQPYDAFRADMWSIGVILFWLLTADLPFKGADKAELQRSVLCGGYALPFEVSPALEDLQGWLLSWNPKERPTAAQARQHAWFAPCPEKAEDQNITLVQPLGAPEDPEARKYLASLGFLPTPEEAMFSGTGGHSLEQNTHTKECALPLEMSSRQSLPELHRVPSLANSRKVHSEPGLPSHESLSPQSQEESTSSSTGTLFPGQVQEERAPSLSLSAAPCPGPVDFQSSASPSLDTSTSSSEAQVEMEGPAAVLVEAVTPAAPVAAEPVEPFPSTCISRSIEDQVVASEIPVSEPEEPGGSPATCVQRRPGRKGLCRRISRAIIKFLRQACCMGPAPDISSGRLGIHSRKVAPS